MARKYFNHCRSKKKRNRLVKIRYDVLEKFLSEIINNDGVYRMDGSWCSSDIIKHQFDTELINKAINILENS